MKKFLIQLENGKNMVVTATTVLAAYNAAICRGYKKANASIWDLNKITNVVCLSNCIKVKLSDTDTED